MLIGREVGRDSNMLIEVLVVLEKRLQAVSKFGWDVGDFRVPVGASEKELVGLPVGVGLSGHDDFGKKIGLEAVASCGDVGAAGWVRRRRAEF